MVTSTSPDVNTATDVNDPGPTVIAAGDVVTRLGDAQAEVERARAEFRGALDARDALVFEAVDIHRMSQRAVARALNGPEHPLGLKPQAVARILSNGPPPEGGSPHPELP